MIKTATRAGIVFILLLALAAPALAARPARVPARIVHDLGTLKIFVERPTVHFLLGRQAPTYKQIRLEKTFVNRIVESTLKNPF